MRRYLIVPLLIAALLGAACGGDSSGEPTSEPGEPQPSTTATASPEPGGDDLDAYVGELDAIDDEWQAGVDAAFEGREYLRTGALPEDFEPTTAALNDLLDAARSNLEELVDVTGTARTEAEALDVPAAADAVHTEYRSILADFEAAWSEGLAFIENDDAEGFLRFYVIFQPAREALEQRLEASRAERSRLASAD